MTDTTFTTRDVPWMQFGTRVTEAVTAAEAMELAGLTWTAERRASTYPGADGTTKTFPGRSTLVRSDTDEPIDVVTSQYEVVQYSEAFDFLDVINPLFVAAGSLKGGKQAFVVVQAPTHLKLDLLGGEDAHDLYVVCRTSHDRSRGLESAVLPLRDKCMNQLAVSSLTSGARQRLTFRHTRNVHARLAEASAVLSNLGKYAEELERTANQLAAIDLELDEARRVLDEVVPEDLKSHDDRVDTILGLYQNSSFNGYTGTGWGLLNAVSEFHDHYHGGDNRSAETRFRQGLAGSTQDAVDRTVRALRLRVR
jgi:phage/plasmid-like protein (TIGR03299 family)